MSLIVSGVPTELVFGSGVVFAEMDAVDRQAWGIVIGQLNGGEFDFNPWDWVRKD